MVAGKMSPKVSRENPQRGIALIVVLVLLGLLVGVLVVGFTGDLARQNKKQQQTADALARAKEALIGRAASDINRPGSLPCPDIDNDGSAESPVAYGGVCPSYIGRFPWRTLGVPDLRDGSGERLWYALTANFRDHPTGGVLNSDTPGQLNIVGTAAASNVIAIVFAPGPVVGSQVRDGANQNAVTNYLEGGNETGIATNTFVTGQPTDAFNDKLLAITSDSLFSVVTMRVIREMRAVLLAYYNANGYFPNANPFSVSSYNCRDGVLQGRIPLSVSNPPNCSAQTNLGWDLSSTPWFFSNQWNRLVFYAVSTPCAGAPNVLCVALGNPLNLSGSPTRALLVGTGRGFGSQINRPCGTANCTVSDLLEDAENTNGDDVFVNPVLSPTNNDHLVVVSP